jgi:hypothetical protein
MRKRDALYTEKRNAQVGDLAFWGTPAFHVGIVTKVTNPKPNKFRVFVTSATTVGVREFRISSLLPAQRFANFGHVELNNVPEPTPDPPTPTPTPTPTPEPTATPAG